VKTKEEALGLGIGLGLGSVKKDVGEVIGPKNKDEVKTKEEAIPSKARTHLKVRVHSWIDSCIG
jgi:hypothetical protein